jgi:catechol 2,3-dioxygenase-like lactoylglutathione lyase family enzyme
MLTSVDHIVVVVNDLSAARRHFVQLLGRSPSWQSEHPELGTRNVLFQLRNTYIELTSPVAGGASATLLHEHLATRGEGLYALAFGTQDAAQAARELRTRGLCADQPKLGMGQDGPSGAYRRFKTVTLPLAETGGIRLLVVEHLFREAALPPALPVADEVAVVDAVDHVVLMTRSPDRANELFGSKLGIRLALDRSFKERGLRLQFFRLGGLTLEIGAQLAQDAELEAPPSQEDLLWGIAYRVPRIDAARERIAKAGIEVSAIRKGHKPGTRVCTVKHKSFGVAALLIEATAKAGTPEETR